MPVADDAIFRMPQNMDCFGAAAAGDDAAGDGARGCSGIGGAAGIASPRLAAAAASTASRLQSSPKSSLSSYMIA